jgi:hypothetical protein
VYSSTLDNYKSSNKITIKILDNLHNSCYAEEEVKR